MKTNNEVENGDTSWFWDPPSSGTSLQPSTSSNLLKSSTDDQLINLTRIKNLEHENEELKKSLIKSESNEKKIEELHQNLRNKISVLENENKELIQNLEQLDTDCQRTTDKLVTLKDNVQSEFNKLKVDFEILQTENVRILEEKLVLEERLKEKEVELKDVAVELKNLQDDIETNNSEKKPIEENLVSRDFIELESKYDSLNVEKNNIVEKLQSIEQNLMVVQKENNSLKSEYDHYRSESVPTEKHKKLLLDFDNLQNKFNELEQKNKNDQEKFYQLHNDLKEMKLNDNTNMQINLSDDHKKLQDMYEELKIKYESIVQERKDMHKKYVNILSENVKKYVDYQFPDDIQKQNENPFTEFTSKVETTLKLLLDFKWKTETLERKLCEISHEKTVAITEKNHEIEKLLHNSEILSQEVITKTQTIKDYEMECTELIKNNDLLISELQQYKNNNGLQTISESNEDNLLLMETQLDNANKRIRELELVITDMENAKQEVVLETQTELDYIKKQLNMTGKELSQSKKEYQELLKNYKQYEHENKMFASELKTLRIEHDNSLEEKRKYISYLEKNQNDLENLEYKYSEANIERESTTQELRTTKEELQTAMTALNAFQNENDSLKINIQSLTEQLDEIKTKYESELKHVQDLECRTLEKEKENVGKIENEYQQLSTEYVTTKKLLDELTQKYNTLQSEVTTLNEKLEEEIKIKNEIEIKYQEKREELSRLDTKNFELSTKVTQLENDLHNLHSSKTELVNFISVKHQENVQYHTEIQRLNHIIATESEKYKALEARMQSIDNSKLLEQKETDIEKLTDQINFLKDKCEKLAQNLLEEQSNTQKTMGERQFILDREQSLAKELERLRAHLVEIEDSYTQELLLAEQKNQEMQSKLNEVEQRERDSSTIYTSVSIRANQQVETLQNQLQLVTVQRDELQKKISDAEDKNNKQFAALTNLQCVLEQFQRDKEIDIVNETERIRRQIRQEKDVQNQLIVEITALKSQLEESKQGLKAASRLSEQLEKSKQQVSAMKDEVSIVQEKMKKTEEKYNALKSQTDGKVDKALIRNLVVGFIGANNSLNKDQTQILKIISTVLDFSQQDNDKLKLNKQQGSWLSAILHPQILNANSNISQQSLSEAFVRFLESESQPKTQAGGPTLLDVSRSRKTSEASNSSRQGSLLLNEVVLPTFADFAQSRSSSAILKDVLKDNNN